MIGMRLLSSTLSFLPPTEVSICPTTLSLIILSRSRSKAGAVATPIGLLGRSPLSIRVFALTSPSKHIRIALRTWLELRS